MAVCMNARSPGRAGGPNAGHRRTWPGRLLAPALVLALSACAPATVTPPADRTPQIQPAPAPTPPQGAPKPAPSPSTGTRSERGKISLYGKAFAGRKTASGDAFDPEAMTMAHRTLPFGTRVRVTNLENKRSVEVVVNDRGPFVDGRIADLSLAAARAIGMLADGVVEAALEIIATPASR